VHLAGHVAPRTSSRAPFQMPDARQRRRDPGHAQSSRSPSSFRARGARHPAWTAAGDSSSVSVHPGVPWAVAPVGQSECPWVPSAIHTKRTRCTYGCANSQVHGPGSERSLNAGVCRGRGPLHEGCEPRNRRHDDLQ
jgi:hypothetical protein